MGEIVNELGHTLMSTLITLAGLGAVVFLAMHGDIHDGETTTAIAAVLGIQIGYTAIRKKNGDPPDGTS